MTWTALCAACAVDVGEDGWCTGHVDEGRRHREWAAGLPPEWPTVVRLWWVASGEARVDRHWLRVARTELATPVSRALPGAPS